MLIEFSRCLFDGARKLRKSDLWDVEKKLFIQIIDLFWAAQYVSESAPAVISGVLLFPNIFYVLG